MYLLHLLRVRRWSLRYYHLRDNKSQKKLLNNGGPGIKPGGKPESKFSVYCICTNLRPLLSVKQKAIN